MSFGSSWRFSLSFVIRGDVGAAALFNLRLSRRGEYPRRGPRRSRCSSRQRGHYQNQQYSVNRARQRLGAFAETDGQLVGDVGHELDEQRSEQGAPKGSKSADDDANQKGKRERKSEAPRRDEADSDRAQAPSHPSVERADAEACGLVERRVDPHRLGSDRMIANGDQRPPDPPPHEVPRGPVERHGAGEADEV